MKPLFLMFLLSLTFLMNTVSVKAQDTARYATCDVCGFCVTSQDPQTWTSITPPGNWGKCQQCLYENANPDPLSGGTLLIDPSTNLPPSPAPGRYYTVFGCIKTQIGDFTQTGAASSLVQVLLNLIFTTAGGVAFLYIIYGSFIIATSQAEPERLAYGKRVVTGAIIGLIFCLSSILLVNFLASGVLKLPGFGAGVSPTKPQ